VPSAACRPWHPGTWPDWISAQDVRRSARFALRPRRADHATAQNRSRTGDELAVARTGAAARAVSSGFGAQGSSAPTPISPMSTGAIPAADWTSPH
jgi:hypothetical protein